ncbi:MAG: LapA family protein [Chitinophagales bacterium]
MKDNKRGIYIGISLFISVILIIFALQNSAVTYLNLLFWEVEASLAITLLGAVMMGIILTLIVAVPTRLKMSKHIKEQQQKLTKVEKMLQEELLENHEIKAKKTSNNETIPEKSQI